MDSPDIRALLDDWPHERGRITARLIEAVDGTVRLQVRLDLGLLQMEVDGRPDGAKPEGAESWLDRHLARRDEYIESGSMPEAFVLGPEECRAIREEAVQYYHRFVALFALGDYARVTRDTTRNLAAFDLCRQFAATDEDRLVLEQFRPAVITMRARADAEAAIERSAPREALAALDRGLAELSACFEQRGGEPAMEESGEAQLLRAMRDALVPKLPASQRAELEERLRAALDAENYELAAILRDELRMM